MKSWLLIMLLFTFSVNELFSEYYIAKKDGTITIENPDEDFGSIALSGQVLKLYDVISCDYDSRILLLNQKGGKVYLSPNSKMAWRKGKSDKLVYHILKGGSKVQLTENKGKDILFLVRYGHIIPEDTELYIANKSDLSTLVELVRGKLKLFHPRTEKELELEEGQTALIDQTGIHLREASDREKKKRRAQFKFREDNEDIIASPLSANNNQKGNAKNLEDSGDGPQKGIAKGGKIVEGQADGEGEYAYKNSGVWLLIIMALVLGSGIAWFFFKRKKQNLAGLDDSGSPFTDVHDVDAYDSANAFIFRENLTNHHGVFKTDKVTHFLGDIEDGAIIEANHKIVIKGSFQGAQLKSKESVTIEGGINGQNKAVLEIDGNLQTPYISEALVLVKGNVDAVQGLRNAKVCANNIQVKRKSIMGGTVSALYGISCQVLGSDYCKTQLLLGESPVHVWRSSFGQKGHERDEIAPYNAKADCQVFDEIISAHIQHGSIKHEQNKAVPGPVSISRSGANSGTLQIRGFRKDES